MVFENLTNLFWPYVLTFNSLKYWKLIENWLIVLGFNNTSTLVGLFVSSPTEREKRDSTGDEREGQGRKRIFWLIVLGFNDNPCGSFCVLSQRKGEKRQKRQQKRWTIRTGKKEEQEWKWRNRRNKIISPIPLPATRIAGLAQLYANITNSWRIPWLKIHNTFTSLDHPQELLKSILCK